MLNEIKKFRKLLKEAHFDERELERVRQLAKDGDPYAQEELKRYEGRTRRRISLKDIAEEYLTKDSDSEIRKFFIEFWTYEKEIFDSIPLCIKFFERKEIKHNFLMDLCDFLSKNKKPTSKKVAAPSEKLRNNIVLATIHLYKFSNDSELYDEAVLITGHDERYFKAMISKPVTKKTLAYELDPSEPYYDFLALERYVNLIGGPSNLSDHEAREFFARQDYFYDEEEGYYDDNEDDE